MMLIDSTTWRAARRALERAVTLYVDDPGVTFIDLGLKASSPLSGELAVRLHYRYQPAGNREMALPNLGFAVEAVESNFRFHLRDAMTETLSPICPELKGGTAIANAAGRVFTLGGKVRDRQTGEIMLLSGWHVLADAWARDESVLIYQPPGNENPAPTLFAEFVRSAISRGLDASVSRLQNGADLQNTQHGLTAVTGVALPQLGMRVQKSGAGSGVTSGVITGILGYSMQRYANRQQLIGPLVCITPENPAEKICAPGDSGAWWLESSTQRAVALHFAGGEQPSFALAFSMPEVLEALEVEIDTTIAPMAPRIEAAPQKTAVTAVAPAPILARQTGNSIEPIDSPVRDVILAADFESIDNAEPSTTEPWHLSVWNALKTFLEQTLQPAAQRFARFGLASMKRGLYLLAQATLIVVAAMSMIGFNRRLANEHQQREGQIEQLQKQLQGIRVIAKIDSARQQELWRIVAIIDRFNPEMNAEVKLNLAAEIYALSLRYHQLDVDLICAVITHESAKSWNPQVVSFAGAMGLMQLLPSTAVGLAPQEGIAWTSAENVLFNPIYNVRLGCRYLAGMIAEHGLEGGLAGYNGGPVQAGKWRRKDSALHPETTFYVPQVMKQYREFQQARTQESAKLTEATNFPKG